MRVCHREDEHVLPDVHLLVKKLLNRVQNLLWLVFESAVEVVSDQFWVDTIWEAEISDDLDGVLG